MNNEYLELIPKWYNEDVKHDLVLSNDIDSLASCAVINKVKGWNIKYFYDFEKIYKVKDHKEVNERCWVDVAIKEGHAFDNHVSRITLMDDWNEDMINLNQINWITNEVYGDKYAGSTLLEVWSLYNLPLPKTEEGKMLLLAIDVAYKGFYNDNFHDIQKYYLCDVMGLNELYNVIKRHNRSEFYDIIAKYGLNADIVCKNGKLSSRLRLKEIGDLLGLELSIPSDTFEIEEELEIIEEKIKSYYSSVDDVDRTLKTLAITFKNNMRYSREKRIIKNNNPFYDLIRRTEECTYVEE